jgi:hypothetical protein
LGLEEKAGNLAIAAEVFMNNHAEAYNSTTASD